MICIQNMTKDSLIAYYRIREKYIEEGCSNYEATLLAYYSISYLQKTNYDEEGV